MWFWQVWVFISHRKRLLEFAFQFRFLKLWSISVLFQRTNVNVRHTYWAPLNPVTEALHAVELTLFLWHMPEDVAEHSFVGCNHQSTCMPSYSLYVQLLWYPMYYPEGMKARVSPVQWSKPYSILAPTQDSNPGGRIQNRKWWPLHYHCTPCFLYELWA